MTNTVRARDNRRVECGPGQALRKPRLACDLARSTNTVSSGSDVATPATRISRCALVASSRIPGRLAACESPEEPCLYCDPWRRRRAREMRLRSGLTCGRSAGQRMTNAVRVRDSRRVECGHVRHSGNRVSPAIWLAVQTRFPPALTWPDPPRGSEMRTRCVESNTRPARRMRQQPARVLLAVFRVIQQAAEPLAILEIVTAGLDEEEPR